MRRDRRRRRSDVKFTNFGDFGDARHQLMLCRVLVSVVTISPPDHGDRRDGDRVATGTLTGQKRDSGIPESVIFSSRLILQHVAPNVPTEAQADT
jgi:hypothetical protein